MSRLLPMSPRTIHLLLCVALMAAGCGRVPKADRLRSRAPNGPLILEHLSFLVVIGGLTGVERIGFRERVRHVEDGSPAEQPLKHELHDPRTDEHNFVFGHAPMVFPEYGTYEVIVEVKVAKKTATYRHRFGIERVGFD